MKPVPFDELPLWETANAEDALKAFKKSCNILKRKPEKILHDVSGHTFSKSAWLNICAQASQTKAPQKFFEQYFQPYLLSNDGNSNGLLTGYFEPSLRGSLTKTQTCNHPVWSKPVGRAPLPTRKVIDQQGLQPEAEILLWVDDPVDLFFLHIQGSGRVSLPDGSMRKLGFAGKNGHPYTSIGKYLIERGEISREAMSMQALKAWLREHPHRQNEVFWQNDSYIFFQFLPDNGGPVGAHGVPLEAEASLAIDPAYHAYGLPFWLVSTVPSVHSSEALKPQGWLAIAQDTGSAIRGKLRGDLFFGHGERAASLAGHMKQKAEFYLFLPKI